jgi:hypothetical protein
MGICVTRKKKCCILLSINNILKRVLEKWNESDVIQTEMQVKCYDYLSLVSIKLDFKQIVKNDVFKTTAKKGMFVVIIQGKVTVLWDVSFSRLWRTVLLSCEW